jgi:hypothetical protein
MIGQPKIIVRAKNEYLAVTVNRDDRAHRRSDIIKRFQLTRVFPFLK